jgi:hypothetical protein
MKVKWLLLIAVLVCVATACSGNGTPKTPEDVYSSFMQACEVGDLSKAETYLTENAIAFLQENRAETANYGEDDPRPEVFQKLGNPCFVYLHNGNATHEYLLMGFEFESDEPDSVEFYEWDTDKAKEESGLDTGYDSVIEVADLVWILDGSTDPLGENLNSEETTYIVTIKVMMVKIGNEWKIEKTS